MIGSGLVGAAEAPSEAPSDVPEVSGDWYRDVVEFADANPEPVQWFMGHFTEASIILLGLLFLLAAWPRLGGGPRDRALALVTPVAVVLAYGCSEGLKVLVDQDRPCRALTDLAIVAEQCPPVGDWSFPSNHSTIAGALATAVVLLHRRIGWYAAVPLAALAAFSRVYVGVHYPHDVVAGVLLGTLVVAVVAPLLARPVSEVLRRRSRRAEDPIPVDRH
ncbi:phosphatase PAP2 family protein [Micromonospora yangpuensis]|uniref:Undecaprenyl-diphosphatase n=1 Tax=Micromonospora yangpuensis TaxID=683228 RepID=A0A1C6TYY2_9ACTN|nr:phosphatase PAP2 family protein [Micromonospora yangpuensis]GGM20405.1 phosphatase PAP2 family protein [Micromonospora yangpuensis]SCL46831.1 undecaprenyl-diphosphatase [Micromonospora yangpuensis]